MQVCFFLANLQGSVSINMLKSIKLTVLSMNFYKGKIVYISLGN